MTDKPGGGDGGDDPPKPPERPDPFAPLPLANLPPVRRRSPLDPEEPAPKKKAPKTEPPRAAEPRAVEPQPQPKPRAEQPRAAEPRAAEPQPYSEQQPRDEQPLLQPRAVEPLPHAEQPRPQSFEPQPQPRAEPQQPQPGSPSVVVEPIAAEPEPRSWTDLPAPPGTPALGPSSAESTESGALSWTDLPAPPQPPVAADEPPLVPASSDPDALRAAVGVAPAKSRRRAPTPVDDDDDDDDDDDRIGRPRNRKMMLIGALTLVVGGGIAAMVILGKINSERYLISCKTDRVAVEQGRSFPPWGESTLDGAEWKALKIPPEAPCTPYETEDKGELAARYFAILRDHAASLLTAREVTKIDEAEAQLKQALLVARSLELEDDRIDARDEIDRLLGDVVYWRASAKLRSAADALTEAAKEFDTAAQQRPRHVTDAAAWALYVRKLADQLRAGPAGATQGTFPPLPPTERPTAPPGVALPVEPGAGSGSTPEPEPAPAPDAGVPTGGVLL